MCLLNSYHLDRRSKTTSFHVIASSHVSSQTRPKPSHQPSRFFPLQSQSQSRCSSHSRWNVRDNQIPKLLFCHSSLVMLEHYRHQAVALSLQYPDSHLSAMECLKRPPYTPAPAARRVTSSLIARSPMSCRILRLRSCDGNIVKGSTGRMKFGT